MHKVTQLQPKKSPLTGSNLVPLGVAAAVAEGEVAKEVEDGVEAYAPPHTSAPWCVPSPQRSAQSSTVLMASQTHHNPSVQRPQCSPRVSKQFLCHLQRKQMLALDNPLATLWHKTIKKRIAKRVNQIQAACGKTK